MDIKLPSSYRQLSRTQFRQLCEIIFSPTMGPFDVRVCLAIKWAGMKYIGAASDGDEHVFIIDRRRRDKGLKYVVLSDDEIQFMSAQLRWIDDTPDFPLRPDFVAGRPALHPMLQDSSLETFIVLDNFYQGYVNTLDMRMLARMAAVMYPRPSWSSPLRRVISYLRPFRPKEWQLTAVFLWFSAFKRVAASLYPDFLKSADREKNLLAPMSPRQSVDALLRALTKGDVTKERQVRAVNCHRALTELNAIAAEAEKLRAQLKKH